MKKILDYVQNKKVNFKTIRTFVQMVLKAETQRFQFSFPVYCKTVFFLSPINGYVRSIQSSRKKHACVVLNSYPFLLSKKERSQTLTWLYVYATVVHELNHLKIQTQLEEGGNYDYASFMAGLCQYNQHRNWIHSLERISDAPDFMRLNHRSLTLLELICTQEGLHRAYAVLNEILSEDESSTINAIIYSVDFLLEHMEVHYSASSQPLYLFKKNLLDIHKKIQVDAGILNQLKQLSLLFDEKGNMHTPLAMFRRIDEENRKFYDAILIHLLVNLQNLTPWEQAFAENPDFHAYMEALANSYCQRSVNYLQDAHIFRAFISPDVLQDNAATLINTTNTLYTWMGIFNMKLTGGIVFPMA